MITREETSLTQNQYDAVMVNGGHMAQRVTIRQRNLEFAEHATGHPTCAALFDAEADAAGTLYKVYISGGNLVLMRLPSEAEEDQSWETVGTLDTGVAAVRPSITNGAEYVFYIKGYAIYRAALPAGSPELVIDNTDINLINNGVGSGGTLSHVAAPDPNTCFVACLRTDYNTNIVGAFYDAGWSTINSDVYWPHEFDGLDAAPLNTGEADSEYVLVLASDLPPILGQHPSGTVVVRRAERRNGMVSFRVQNNRFSDHFLVEVFDNASDYQCRVEPRLTALASKIVLTAFGKDGRDSHYHAALHYYFTVDGRMWESDQLLNLDTTYNGAAMVVVGNYVYLVGETAAYRSLSTEMVGPTHPSLIEDITSKIVGYSSNQQATRQTTFYLKNTGWYDTSLLSKSAQLSVKTELGIWSDSEKALVEVANELIDVSGVDRERPSERITIQARDHSALLSGLVRSPHSREYDTQVVGADKFYDFTGTGYGGMAHTATVEGSWSTGDNWLKLSSGNKKGTAWNTFKTDALWNGLIEAKIQIDTPESVPDNPVDKEFAGLVIRAYDKGNYVAIEYVVEDDLLRLCRYNEGQRTVLMQSLDMGWEYDAPFYVRVMFRYSKIAVYQSNDGKDWTPLFEHLLSGAAPMPAIPTGPAPVTFEDGLVGYTGLGYQREDIWPGPIIPDLPPDPGGTNWGTGTKSGIIAINMRTPNPGAKYYGMVAYSRSCTTGPWNLLHGGITTLTDGKPQPIAAIWLDPYDFDACYLVMGNGDVYYNPAWRSGASWQQIENRDNMANMLVTKYPTASFAGVSSAYVTMAADGYLVLQMKVKGIPYTGAEGTYVLFRVRRKQAGLDMSPAQRLNSGNYTNSGLKRGQVTVGAHIGTLVAATGTGYWGREHRGIWIADWTTTGTDWSCFPTINDYGVIFWTPRYSMSFGGDKPESPLLPWTNLSGAENASDNQVFWAGPADKIYKSENQGTTFVAWTGEGVAPRAAGYGAAIDTFELNTDKGQWVHFIRASGDNAVQDKLYLSNTGGSSWRSIMLPTRNWVGWTGGFPSRDGQFYIAASRWAYPASEAGFKTLLLFSRDGGESWNDWTHNLWVLKQQITGLQAGMGVVRFYPHPTER